MPRGCPRLFALLCATILLGSCDKEPLPPDDADPSPNPIVVQPNPEHPYSNTPRLYPPARPGFSADDSRH